MASRGWLKAAPKVPEKSVPVWAPRTEAAEPRRQPAAAAKPLWVPRKRRPAASLEPEAGGKPATPGTGKSAERGSRGRERALLFIVLALLPLSFLVNWMSGSGPAQGTGRGALVAAMNQRKKAKPSVDETPPPSPARTIEEVEERPEAVRELVERIQRGDYESPDEVATGRSLQKFSDKASLVEKIDPSTLKPYGKSSRWMIVRKADLGRPFFTGIEEFLMLEFVWVEKNWKLEHVELRNYTASSD